MNGFCKANWQVKEAMSNAEDLVGLLTDARASRDWAVCDVKYSEPQLHFSFKVSIHESFFFFAFLQQIPANLILLGELS